MANIHFLNVNQGDCSVVVHDSGRITVIDVCNAKPMDRTDEEQTAVMARLEKGPSGDFRQRKYPVNPVSYLQDRGIENVFRYVQTHPDLDHMDGIRAFFDRFRPLNFWDTENNKEIENSAWARSPYDKEDWKFYKHLRDSNPNENPRRLTLLDNARGQYWNVGDNSRDGDGLHVLAPTQKLIDSANQTDRDYNDCSYVLLYRTEDNRIIFGGDSHDDTWDHILEVHRNEVADVDLLIAPHHGRDSGRSYEFLDVLRPTLTFFGNARSQHLAYSAWRDRGLSYVTNNQANCMIVDASRTPMVLYVTHENFARRVNPLTFFDVAYQAWYVGPISEYAAP